MLLYSCRAIYDGDEHQKFMERLDARIKSHDKDIERMCNFHYQGFIDSIRELLQVRSQAKNLNVSISVKFMVLI
jgi:predicted transport protein